MKIAFPTSGTNLSGLLDGRFGRAQRFLIVDSETGSFEALENDQNVDASQGAGIQSAQAVIAAGAEILVTTHCGPKAYKVFSSGMVRILQAPVAPISDLLQMVRAGSLAEMEAPHKPGSM